MAELKAVISKCIILAANLNPTLNRNRYLSRLSDVSADDNYSTFTIFASDISNNLLATLYSLGYFNEREDLWRIAVEMIQMRNLCNHVEEDVGGHVDRLLTDYLSNVYGKCFIYINIRERSHYKYT